MGVVWHGAQSLVLSENSPGDHNIQPEMGTVMSADFCLLFFLLSIDQQLPNYIFSISSPHITPEFHIHTISGSLHVCTWTLNQHLEYYTCRLELALLRLLLLSQ